MNSKTIFILILTIISSLPTFSQSSESPDTVCVASDVYYKIPNPIVSSIYTWGIYNNEGSITFGAGTDSIRVEWNNTAGIDSLWVFETNLANCKGDTAKLKVVRVALPTAEFDNSTLCNGENLNVNFTGYPPWQVEYTLNGNTVIQTGILLNPYLVGGTAGNYVLVQISDKHCSNSTSSGTVNAVIAEPLQQLQIFHE